MLNEKNEGVFYTQVNDDIYQVEIELSRKFDRYYVTYNNGSKWEITFFQDDEEYRCLAPDYEAEEYITECIRRDLKAKKCQI